jgi:hypothetical protein
MDIHKPKPWHGVREFLKEYLIIVVGVLTALAGEQAVEWAHNRAELDEAREALHEEVVQGAGAIRANGIEARCGLVQTERYEAWARGGPKPQFTIGAMFPRPLDTVWQSLRAGPVARMPQKEKLAYARYYDLAANNRALSDKILDLGLAIRGAQGLDRLTPAEADTMRQQIMMGRTLTTAMRANRPIELAAARALGVEPPPIRPGARAHIQAECAEAGVAYSEAES